MDFFSNDPKADTIKRVRGEISEVRSVMVDNIDKARWHLPSHGLLRMSTRSVRVVSQSPK